MQDLDNLDYWMAEFGSPAETSGFKVSAEEAAGIDKQVTDGICEIIRFTDISGSRCIYPRSCFHGLYESTVAQREHGREHQRRIKAEDPSIGIDT